MYTHPFIIPLVALAVIAYFGFRIAGQTYDEEKRERIEGLTYIPFLGVVLIVWIWGVLDFRVLIVAFAASLIFAFRAKRAERMATTETLRQRASQQFNLAALLAIGSFLYAVASAYSDHSR